MSSRKFKFIEDFFSNLDENIIGVLTYVIPILLLLIPNICYLIWLVPVIVLIYNFNNHFIKIHSTYAILLQVTYTLNNMTIIFIKSKIIYLFIRKPFPIYWINLLSIFITPLVLGCTIIFVYLSIYCIISAYNNELPNIPIISYICSKIYDI